MLNNEFSDPLCGHLAEELGQEVDDAALISIDSRGVDVRVRQGARVSMLRFWSGSVFLASWLLDNLLVDRKGWGWKTAPVTTQGRRLAGAARGSGELLFALRF